MKAIKVMKATKIKRTIIVSSMFITSFLFLAASCSTFKRQTRSVNYAVGLALVETDKQFREYVESAEGSKTLCMWIIEENENVIKMGTYTKEMMHDDCERHIDRIWHRYSRIMASCSLILEVFEESVNIWEHLDSNQKGKVIGDTMCMIKDLVDFLDEVGVPVPSELMSYSKWLDILAGNF